jgi:hypothetical protein
MNTPILPQLVYNPREVDSSRQLFFGTEVVAMGEDKIDLSDTIILTPEEKDEITQIAPEEEVQDNEEDEAQDS